MLLFSCNIKDTMILELIYLNYLVSTNPSVSQRKTEKPKRERKHGIRQQGAQEREPLTCFSLQYLLGTGGRAQQWQMEPERLSIRLSSPSSEPWITRDTESNMGLRYRPSHLQTEKSTVRKKEREQTETQTQAEERRDSVKATVHRQQKQGRKEVHRQQFKRPHGGQTYMERN